VTKFIAMGVINFVTLTAAAKQELLFNKPTSVQKSRVFSRRGSSLKPQIMDKDERLASKKHPSLVVLSISKK
jgi:hypothetical protein